MLACGGNPDPKSGANARASETKTLEPAVAAAQQPEEAVPTRCVKRMNACMPPIKWAENLCGDVYEDLALYMFREGTPWTRFYMKTGLNAVNGWGPTLDEDMVTREEVLVINHRLSKDALQVEGSDGTYDVFRWNGSCVTLDVNEVTAKKPSQVENPRIDWLALSDPMRDTLMKNSEVAELHEQRRIACKGASVGRVTQECEELDKEFMALVADTVRHTTDLPTPAELPE